MIKDITIKTNNKHWNRLLGGKQKENLNFSFEKGINVITSENGTGKSTFFDLIQHRILENEYQDSIDVSTFYQKGDKPRNFFFIPIQDLDPRRQLDKISPNDSDSTNKIAFYYNRLNLSHGQSNNEILLDIEELSNNSDMIFIDEPELALDTMNALSFIKKIKKLSKKTQFIIISHHPYFIFNKDFNVINFGSSNYLQYIKTEVNKLNLDI